MYVHQLLLHVLNIKNMKKITTLLLAATFGMIAFASESHKIKTDKSTVEYVGKKESGEHRGNFNIKEGHLDMDGDKITGGSFVIDLTSVTCTDMQGEWGEKFVQHLKAADFLNIELSATATLTIKSSEAKGAHKHHITAELEFRGVTKTITFDAEIKDHKATATIDFEQALWGITYSGKADDPIKPNSTINVSLELE